MASLGGETWTRRYSGAQAREIVGQLKPVTAPFEGAARRSSASAGDRSSPVNKVGSQVASKRGALDPRSAETGHPLHKEAARVCDPNHHGETLAY